MKWIEEIKTLDLSKKKYSQTGEEIILQHIFKKIGTTNQYLVDFGAGDGFTLSNSALLLENGWTGLRMDGNNRGNQTVKREFITPFNIVDLFEKYEVPHEFDFLSIDMDSCDFQVLNQILINQYRPRIVCAEYNPAFNVGESKYLKYEEGYMWDETTKYGFSLNAGRRLMDSHGYSLFYNQNFLNLFFIDNNLFGKLDIAVPDQKMIFHPVSQNAEWVTF